MKIEHVAMYVNDLEAARDFFVLYLEGKSNNGYHNPKTDFRSYFINFDDGAILEIMNKPLMSDTEKGLNRTGYIHIAFSLGSKSAVLPIIGEAEYRTLRSQPARKFYSVGLSDAVVHRRRQLAANGQN